MKNPELDLALDFVEKTNRNIFLTGKAGTGKTTFLHNIKSKSMKRLVVVAPTGVAAINAKGVTIHSFFQMPFGPIIPGVDSHQEQYQRKFNRSKINIIRSLDLLIIDEISMVRADLLDGIDQVLRRYKDRNKVFGGVQVLMIGDLQQLSPVVKPQEWELLKGHYENAFFFSSKAFQESNAISIELKHIYRQADEKFIHILNEIRNNKLSSESATTLNELYDPDFVPEEDSGYITLTTHNSRANVINEKELDKLDRRSQTYTAEVDGKFSEYSYPTHERLVLKEGAQVMFIKNDSSVDKRYYNGKIGKVISITGDSLRVRCEGDEESIFVEREVWENTAYTIDKNTKAIKNKVVGSFSQIPLRLAWAITIHKSQGLTFEKAIIDAEASFAHGQTYVALSRCKSLEGIVLKSKIKDSSIISDTQVNSFTQGVEDNQPDIEDLDKSRKAYHLSMINELFNYYEFTYPIKRILDICYANKTIIEGNILETIISIKDEAINNLLKIAHTFNVQIENLSQDIVDLENDEHVVERLKKAITYFLKYSQEKIETPFKSISFSTDNTKVKKDLNMQLDRLEDLITIRIYCLAGLTETFTVAKYLELRAKASIKDAKSSKKSKTSREVISSTDHPGLFKKLKELRHRLAEEEDVEHYQIFTQKSLYEMCEYFPINSKSLRGINGMGKIRVQKYGDAIIDIISEYIQDKGLEPKDIKVEKHKVDKDSSRSISLEMFKTGKSIEEIAKARGLVTSTIESHLSFYVPLGEISITDLMAEDKYKELKKLIKTTKFESLSDLKHKIDDKFTYQELRLVSQELAMESLKKD